MSASSLSERNTVKRRRSDDTDSEATPSPLEDEVEHDGKNENDEKDGNKTTEHENEKSKSEMDVTTDEKKLVVKSKAVSLPLPLPIKKCTNCSFKCERPDKFCRDCGYQFKRFKKTKLEVQSEKDAKKAKEVHMLSEQDKLSIRKIMEEHEKTHQEQKPSAVEFKPSHTTLKLTLEDEIKNTRIKPQAFSSLGGLGGAFKITDECDRLFILKDSVDPDLVHIDVSSQDLLDLIKLNQNAKSKTYFGDIYTTELITFPLSAKLTKKKKLALEKSLVEYRSKKLLYHSHYLPDILQIITNELKVNAQQHNISEINKWRTTQNADINVYLSLTEEMQAQQENKPELWIKAPESVRREILEYRTGLHPVKGDQGPL